MNDELGFTLVEVLVALAIAAMWSGEEPQQPPTMLTKPDSAHSETCSAIASASRSYSPNSFGRPALG